MLILWVIVRFNDFNDPNNDLQLLQPHSLRSDFTGLIIAALMPW